MSDSNQTCKFVAARLRPAIDRARITEGPPRFEVSVLTIASVVRVNRSRRFHAAGTAHHTGVSQSSGGLQAFESGALGFLASELPFAKDRTGLGWTAAFSHSC